jgi:hypothetical protein
MSFFGSFSIRINTSLPKGEVTMTRKQLVGTWKLVSAEVQCADGQVIYVYGENPRGMIIYDSRGNVSVNLMRSDRDFFSVADKTRSTLQEAKSAIETYEAYFGTYEVDEENRIVVHHVEGSLLPNWTGSDQVRFFKFSNDCLILSTAEIPYAGTVAVGKLVWKWAA